MKADFFSLSRLLWQLTVQTSQVLPGLLDDWGYSGPRQSLRLRKRAHTV